MSEPARESQSPPRAEIVVDLGAISRNVRRLRELVTDSDGVAPRIMVVVKADAYGHGMVPAARAARAADAEWLGVATLDEALELRAAGDTGRVLSWLATPGEDFAAAIAHDIDVAAYDVAQLDEIVSAARHRQAPARVQLKIDTGLSRGGSAADLWHGLVGAAAGAERAGHIGVTGIWSHFACSDEPDHPANLQQEKAFRDALGEAERAGLRPEVRHLANSAGALHRTSARFDLVRFGIASYGVAPAPDVATSAELGLSPAMTVRGRIVLGKDLPAGSGISYGHTFVTESELHVALVPMGYGDGIPRHASNTAEVLVGGHRAPVRGRICMDQFVVEAPHARAGDEVIVFGPGTAGEPTADDWARWCDTINYEIVTRIGGRQRRTWIEGTTP